MANSFGTLKTSLDDGVFTITLNRPDLLNVCNEQMGSELSAALKTAQRDKTARCVVLTGAGRAFCAGQDLRELDEMQTGPDGEKFSFGPLLRARYNPLAARLRTFEKPVVAAVNGIAAGAGAGLAFAADLRICARSAAFKMAFVDLGLVPDTGATLTLVQHVGYARASELCLLGEKLSAEEALRYGLVSRVVADEELESATRQVAGRLAAWPPRAIALTKRALNRAWTAALDEQLEQEAFLQTTAGRTADHREAVRAFLEKRKPKFQGK
jgi:2-(1,2-epoxy-1,2-dihydrophenyl)acetyl-CoA isomerase